MDTYGDAGGYGDAAELYGGGDDVGGGRRKTRLPRNPRRYSV